MYSNNLVLIGDPNKCIFFMIDGKVVGNVLSLGYFERDLDSPHRDVEKIKGEMVRKRSLVCCIDICLSCPVAHC